MRKKNQGCLFTLEASLNLFLEACDPEDFFKLFNNPDVMFTVTGFCQNLLPSVSPWLFTFSSVSLFYRSNWGCSLNSNFYLNPSIPQSQLKLHSGPHLFLSISFCSFQLSREPFSRWVGVQRRASYHPMPHYSPNWEGGWGQTGPKQSQQLSQKALIRSLWPISLHRSPFLSLERIGWGGGLDPCGAADLTPDRSSPQRPTFVSVCEYSTDKLC